MKNQESIFQTNLSIIIDVNFESVFKAYNVEEPQVKCSGGNIIQRLCTNSLCDKPAFHCSKKQCQKCFQGHKQCCSAWFQCFTSFLKKREGYQKSFFQKIYQIDNDLIEKIKSSNQEIAKMISFGSLDEKYMKQIQSLYVKKDSSNFKGKQSEELLLKLKQKVEINKESEEKLQKTYQKRSNRLIQEDIRFKKQIYSCFLTKSNIKQPQEQKWFIDSPLIKACLAAMYANTPQWYKNKEKVQYFYFQLIDKDRYAFDKDRIKYLQQQIGNPISSTLLYRASENNYSIAQFHTKCNDKQNTLTIIRTEFGKTIFAFASQKWHSSGSYANDTTNKSCIILLDLKIKCSLTSPSNSIYCGANYGPTFGAHDIYISDQCNINNNSYCNFPTSYNNGYTNNQLSHTTICGAPSGYKFKVVDYEVFQLRYQ